MHEVALGELCSLIVDSEHKTARRMPLGLIRLSALQISERLAPTYPELSA